MISLPPLSNQQGAAFAQSSASTVCTAISSPPRMQDFIFDHFLSSIDGSQNSAQFYTAPSASNASHLQTQHQLAGIYTMSPVDTGPHPDPRPGHDSPVYDHHTQHNERKVGRFREASGSASAEASQFINQISVYQARAQVPAAGPTPSPTRAQPQASPQYSYHQQASVSATICGLGLVHMLSPLYSNETSKQHTPLYIAPPQQQEHRDVPNYVQTLDTAVNFDALGGSYSYIPEYTADPSLYTASYPPYSTQILPSSHASSYTASTPPYRSVQAVNDHVQNFQPQHQPNHPSSFSISKPTGAEAFYRSSAPHYSPAFCHSLPSYNARYGIQTSSANFTALQAVPSSSTATIFPIYSPSDLAIGKSIQDKIWAEQQHNQRVKALGRLALEAKQQHQEIIERQERSAREEEEAY